MRKTIKLALTAAMVLGTTSAFATNGSDMMATGAKSTGMGGTGIGVSHGAESALSNPALITTVKDTEISFGGIIFMPDVSTDGGTGGMTSYSSEADMNVIPEVSIASKVTDNLYMGIGMWGTAGMGVDYRNADTTMGGAMNMVTNLQLMQFGVPIAYTTNGFSVAVTPILQYGSLDMDYNADMDQDGTPEHYGAGVSQDLKFGYNMGLSYEIANVTIGATYVGQIDMDYTGQPGGITELSTPATMGIGASYKFDGSTIAIDYKQINWEDAEGYKDFGWVNQNVMALGYEYATKSWAARIGYNYASSPIENTPLGTTPTSMTQATMNNMFNLTGFPAIVESHITLGGTYAVSDRTSFDLAYVYSSETSEKFDIMTAQGASTIETKHSQTAMSFQLNYLF